MIEWVNAEWVKASGTLVLVVHPMMMILVGVLTIPGCSSPGLTKSWSAIDQWCSSLGWAAMSSMSLPEQLVDARIGRTMMG